MQRRAASTTIPRTTPPMLSRRTEHSSASIRLRTSGNIMSFPTTGGKTSSVQTLDMPRSQRIQRLRRHHTVRRTTVRCGKYTAHPSTRVILWMRARLLVLSGSCQATQWARTVLHHVGLRCQAKCGDIHRVQTYGSKALTFPRVRPGNNTTTPSPALVSGGDSD